MTRWRELGVVAILALELALFSLLLGDSFANLSNAALILKYTSIFGIAAIGAALVIASGGIDLAPGAVIALVSVVTGHLFLTLQLPLALAILAGRFAGFDNDEWWQRSQFIPHLEVVADWIKVMAPQGFELLTPEDTADSIEIELPSNQIFERT